MKRTFATGLQFFNAFLGKYILHTFILNFEEMHYSFHPDVDYLMGINNMF